MSDCSTEAFKPHARMTKTKSQLRAEAVERLRKLNCMDVDCYQLLEATVDDAGEKVGYRVEIRKLIELLTDDAHESRGSYEERLYDVPVSDCPYCGCNRVVIHDFSDMYDNPHSYRVEHMDEKEAFETGCFETYYAFDSVEKAVEHANMRDTLTDEPTNGIEGETNGIADGSPLVDEPPESDAIAHARWRWKYRPEDGDEVVMTEYNCNLLMSDLDAIADMVERDYVSREMYDSERNLLLDKLVAADDAFIELKSRHCPHYHADKHYCDVWETRIKALTAERDEWKAKAEGSSNVRASDMLTDNETCPNGDGTCPDVDGTPSIEQGDDGVAKLDAQARAEIEDAERSRAVSGDAAAEVDSGTEKTPQEPRECARITFTDTREMLEADVSAWIANEMGVLAKYGIEDAVLQQAVFEWLDRQAAITQNETIHDYNIAARESGRILRDEIAERYMKLPVDADGVPIHLGDRLECYANGYGGTFTVFAIGNDTVVGDHDIEWIRDNPSKWFHVALSCHNVKPRTVEDVLADYARDLASDRTDSYEHRIERLGTKYADELRELLGSDAR